mmetsp:Transcript_9915/g.27987  ORF Transcript_9915/g.27987 Transcript_9915/m.27987 type:complete len:277 (+) Transcript_9915:1427-2257(+)
MGHRGGHAQPRQVAVVEVVPDPCQGPVDGVATRVCPNGVALVRVLAGRQDGPAELRRGRAPVHDHRRGAEGGMVRRQRRRDLLGDIHLGDGGRVVVGGHVAQDQGDGLVVQGGEASLRRGHGRAGGRPVGRHGVQDLPRAVLIPHRAEDTLGHGVACRRAELPVPGVAQAREDVAVGAERGVHGRRVDAHVRVRFVQLDDALVGGQDREDDDLPRAPALQLRDRCVDRPGRRDHRLQDEGEVRHVVPGQPAVVLDGLGAKVAVHAEHAQVVDNCIR